MNIKTLISVYVTHEEVYKAGDIIIEEGSSEDWVYILLEGKAKVTKRTPMGRLTLSTLEKGSVFGEMEFFGSALTARCASVIAVDNDVKVGVLDAQQLNRDYESLSLQLRLLIKALIMGLKESNEKVAALIADTHRKRPKNR